MLSPKALFCFILLCASIMGFAQNKSVTISGTVKENGTQAPVAYANVVLKTQNNTAAAATITTQTGNFSLNEITPGKYTVEISIIGFTTLTKNIYVGTLSEFLNLGEFTLTTSTQELNEVVISSKQNEIGSKMDKKTFSLSDNIAQSGGSVLQALQNLPGVTAQDGKVLLRGNDKVTILIDGKQTALTGFNSQSGLDNLPASAIDKIEIINNPSAKYEANGNAGIINIILKKTKDMGFKGKVGLTSGLGALWERKANLPTIRPQYRATPKINPSVSLNYRKEKINIYFQGDYLYTQTLNKNEFVNRIYDDGTIINQQTKRNRDTQFTNLKTGIDWNYNKNNTIAFSALFGSEKILDHGDEPFFNSDYTQRLRLWKFLEDELKTTAMASATYQHKFAEAGHVLNTGINYTFHRENEKYFFNNILPTSNGTDAFKLLSDENILDVNIDYIKPLASGHLETGFKFRKRIIPTNMQFFPGENSVIDANAGGKATYSELIPAAYGNYVYENNNIEAEAGVRVEYLDLQYKVNPNHPVYKTNGYHYLEPFPSLRFGYKINDNNKITLFYNRRVDRPNEVDIRIFPKYDDAEIIKVGNPGLRPQFTNTAELGYKNNLKKGYLVTSAYYKHVQGTINRIAITQPNNTFIYNVFQNTGNSNMMGIETMFSYKAASWYTYNINATVYNNTIDAFSGTVLYPQPTAYTVSKEQITSGNIKWNNTFTFSSTLSGQLMAAWLAPDIIPQGKTLARFSTDIGLKKIVQKGRGEFYINATDLFNTLVIRKEVQGNGFKYTSKDYYETQVIRFGYNYKF